jgi:hypothetical protein
MMVCGRWWRTPTGRRKSTGGGMAAKGTGKRFSRQPPREPTKPRPPPARRAHAANAPCYARGLAQPDQARIPADRAEAPATATNCGRRSNPARRPRSQRRCRQLRSRGRRDRGGVSAQAGGARSAHDAGGESGGRPGVAKRAGCRVAGAQAQVGR